MAQSRDSSPVYYREIQKNAYLKRMPDDTSGSKLRPLALKKTQLKPMWTQLCVHNGRTPYLEQYRDPIAARSHRPAWRASLATARHVTASVTPRDSEYDFLVDTHNGPVRMLAPSWESMQDWVSTLRNKLHELKIVSLCENLYVAPAVPAPPRAAARDPTSPLPPTPPLPPQRVPGIDLTSVTRGPPIPEEPSPSTECPDPPEPPEQPPEPEIDISNWDDLTLPSTSQAPTSVAKICGQNICLDDSLLKRGDSDDDDKYNDSDSYRQTVVVESTADDVPNERPSNITVIQVSNKDPPHTAIPVIGSETDVFNFDFKPPSAESPNFVNIVHTETVHNDYGTVFNGESDYGHLSLTTTVSLTGGVKNNEDLYERLCMGSSEASPLPVRKLMNQEKIRKSSLPNLDSNSTYEYLFLSENNNSYDNVAPRIDANSTLNANVTSISTTFSTPLSNHSTSVSTLSTPISVHSISTPVQSTPISVHSISTPVQSTPISVHSISTPVQSTPISVHSISTPVQSTPISVNSTSASNHSTSMSAQSTTMPILSTTNSLTNTSIVNVDSAVNGRNLVTIVDSNALGLRSHLERTHSHNAYDSRRGRRPNDGPKANVKLDKSEPQHKPIWKRGLTELSLLSRLRGIGQAKRSDSPARQTDNDRNGVSSPKVMHRLRPEVRVDRSRRRSSSLSNGQSPPSTSTQALQPLRERQAAALIAAQRRSAAIVGCVSTVEPPIFADYNKQVWVAWWGAGGSRCSGRTGDRVCGLMAAAPTDANHARQLLHSTRAHAVDILFHRVPLGKIYVVNKRDRESMGIKLDTECNITGVEPESPAARAGIPPPGRWAVTEVNNRPVNLIKGGEDDMNRLCFHGSEASVLIQPSALVKKLRAALKGNKTLLGLR